MWDTRSLNIIGSLGIKRAKGSNFARVALPLAHTCTCKSLQRD
ncbi:hypothetical protein [uncultured Helicobacter sp.]